MDQKRTARKIAWTRKKRQGELLQKIASTSGIQGANITKIMKKSSFDDFYRQTSSDNNFQYFLCGMYYQQQSL